MRKQKREGGAFGHVARDRREKQKRTTEARRKRKNEPKSRSRNLRRDGGAHALEPRGKAKRLTYMGWDGRGIQEMKGRASGGGGKK